MFIQQTHFLGWPDIRMFRIQRCFTWLTIEETYGWVHLCEEKKVEKGSLSKGEGEGEGEGEA